SPMKKLFAAGFLSLAMLGMANAPASAWFNCCHPWRCCGKCVQTICCRPYNAFTPVCFGTICCTGCCPLATCCPMPLTGPMDSIPGPSCAFPGDGPGCFGPSCGGPSCGPDCGGGAMPPGGAVDTGPIPDGAVMGNGGGAPGFTPPMPSQADGA